MHKPPIEATQKMQVLQRECESHRIFQMHYKVQQKQKMIQQPGPLMSR